RLPARRGGGRRRSRPSEEVRPSARRPPPRLRPRRSRRSMCTCRWLFRQVLFEEGPDLLPAVEGLFDPVHRSVVIEEAVARAVIAVELIILAVLLQLFLVLVDLLRARRPVLVAEQPEQRAGKVLRQLDPRHRQLLGQLFLAHHHATAPDIGDGVAALRLAGIEERMAPSGAGADHADLAVEPGLPAQPLHRSLGITDHLRVRNAALGARLGGDIVGPALAEALIEVMADRGITVMGEAARRFTVP